LKPEILTYEETRGAVWQKLRAYIELRMESKREANDQSGMSSEKTECLRGEIKALKGLITAVEPKRYG